MHGRSGDIASEQEEALAALLGPGRGATSGAGGTAIRPGAPIVTPRTGAATPAWLPWAALFGGGAIGVGCIRGGQWLAGHAVPRLFAAEPAPAAVDALYALAIYLPMLLLTLAAGAATRVPPLRAGRAPLRMAGLGAAIGAGGFALTVALAEVAGAARGGVGGGGLLVLAGSLVMLLAAGTEEVLLRGWMQPALATRWPAWAAVIVSAAVFAGLHVLGGARSPVSLVNLTLGGVLFGLLRWKSGGMAAPVAAHFAWNWSEGLLLGLDPNPGVGGFGALFDLDMVGPAIWGGSDEGLNASLAMMLVLAALIVPLALWKPKAG